MQYSSDYIINRDKSLTTEIETLEKKGFYFSLFRLFSFLASVTFVILAINIKTLTYVFCALAFVIFAIFIALCVIHYKSSQILKSKKSIREINLEYLARINGDFSKLKDKGDEFIVPNHDYCIDLDLFGEQSLFSLYNISESAFGRRWFSKELLYAHTDSRTNDELKALQVAIHEFSEDLEFLQEYQSLGRLGKLKKMPLALLNFSVEGNYSFDKKNKIVAWVLRSLWIVPLVLLFVSAKLVVPAVLSVILFNLIASFFMAGNYSKYFRTIDGIRRQGGTIYKLYQKLESKSFKSDVINSLLKSDENSERISFGLKELSKVCGLCSLRNQPLFALVLNALFLYDSVCAEKLCAWASKYGKNIDATIDGLAKLESMMSASVVEIVSKESTRPVFVSAKEVNEEAYFKGVDMIHPLLNKESAVSNSIELNSDIAMITGSNMSGKTTLIRTVGTISVLSYIGANVPAKSVTLGRMRIMSSMRIVDSIKEEMSTFRAELVRIASIVNAARENRPMLFLIDEIFRGTNSADRTSGALEVLKTLSRPMVIGFMTTHDYALCDQTKETMPNISYYHFSETYVDESIVFDYKLKDGMTKISNAKQLMKLVGIII